MTAFASSDLSEVEARARDSHGSSADAIYLMAARFLAERRVSAGLLCDIGCGRGNLWNYVRAHASAYAGVDAVRYEGFPEGCDFIAANLDRGALPLPDSSADTVASIETIEHLENPRAFVRELARVVKPGGWIIITTPNQLSLLSKGSLVLKNQFSAFQEAQGLYPAHLTALVEIDLVRIARECRLVDIEIRYSNTGRVPLTRWHWPRRLGFGGRAFSDNVMMAARKPAA